MPTIRLRQGFHLGNHGDTPSGSAVDLIRKSKAPALLAMRNVKPEKIEFWAQETPNGHLILREHFACKGVLADRDRVLTWADHQATMIDDYLKFESFRRIYDNGNMGAKIFNEPNMVGRDEGFGNDEIGMRVYNELYPLAAELLHRRFPNIKTIGYSLTPGNRDAFFRGDPSNVDYWFHGKEAAKENPTAAEIEAAKRSCLTRTSQDFMDWFGIHVYPLPGTWDKDYLGLRFKQFWKFLPEKLVNNTFILEASVADDAGQDVRAVESEKWFWELQKYPQIKAVTLWWLRYGDHTWERNFHDNPDGSFRPVAYTIINFNNNPMAEVPVPPNPVPVPPTPAPTPPSVDLGPEFTELKITKIPASGMKHGDYYWKLISATIDKNSGTHHAFFKVLNENGNHQHSVPCRVEWADDSVVVPTKAEPDWADVALWASYDPAVTSGPYTASIDGLPSDKIAGLGLPLNHHFSYFLLYRKTKYVAETQPPIPTPPPPTPVPVPPTPVPPVPVNILGEVRNSAWNKLGIPYNPETYFFKFSVEKALGRPLSGEYNATFNKKPYLVQLFDKGIVYCEIHNGTVALHTTKWATWS